MEYKLWEEFSNLLRERGSFGMKKAPKFTNLLLKQIEEEKSSLSKKPSPIPILCSLLNMTVNPGFL